MVKGSSDVAFTFNKLRDHLQSDDEVRQYAQDACVLAVTETIEGAIRRAGINRAVVAERIGKTKGFVSQVLNGSRNMTLKTAADLLWSVGLEVRGLETAPLGESVVPAAFVNQWLDDECNVIRATSISVGNRPALRLELEGKPGLVAA